MKRILSKISSCLWMIVLLPLLSGCNNEDDVIAIFTGKTWKMTFIAAEGLTKQYNFWGEAGMNDKNPAFTNSMNALKGDGTFILNFEGTDLNGRIEGSLNGRAIITSLNGTWSANGESHDFRTSIKGNSSETDVLGKAFITGLKNAVRYEGDENNLYIYYKEGQTTKFIAFRHAKK